MPPTQFASSDPLPEGGRPRIARPSRLDHPLELPGEKAEKAGAKLGLTSIATLLDHIPRDRRAARTIGDLGRRGDRDRGGRGALDHEPARCAGVA